MQKRLLTLVLVVIIGVLVGVGIVKKQASTPVLRELLKKQNQIIQSQNKLERILLSDAGSGMNKAAGSKFAAFLEKQKDLEARLAKIEEKIKSIQGAFGKAGANARPSPPPEDLTKVYDIAVAHSPIRGNKNAPVTIVEFADFQCPFCARFHASIAEVMKAYPKKVNYVLKNFPLSFHQQAKPAAKAAFAAGEQGKYWEMADALLENGKSLNEEKFKEIAGDIGLNVDKFMKDYKDKDAQWEGYIQKDMSLAQKVNVRGTPTFYINGKKTNARDFNSFKREIDQILNK